MTKTRSISQNSNSQNFEKQNSKKMIALAKVFESHEHALLEIQKQLQIITGSCKELLKQRISAKFPIQVLELFSSTVMEETQSLHLSIPSRIVLSKSYDNTPEHQKVMMVSYHLEEETLIWFQDAEQASGFPN